MKLSMEAGWFTEERMPDGSRRRVLQSQDHLDEGEVLPALVIEAGGINRAGAIGLVRPILSRAPALP